MDVTDLRSDRLDTSRFTGPLFRPGDIGYDAERKGFNVSLDDHPALVVGATGPGDVVAAIEYAAVAGRAVGVMATGHGPAVPADGQVLVNTRRMDRIEVDPGARTARVDAGVRWGRALSEITSYGLAALNGASPDVGVVGYTLGGGIGPLGRRYGFAADRVRTLDVVTADGRLRRVSATSEPELFWALRGGKGNFGIVVSMEFELVPVARLYGGGIYFAADTAAAALHAYCSWVADVPEEMTSSVRMIGFPDLPTVPAPLRGRFVTGILTAFCGSTADGERLVAPLRNIGDPLLDTIATIPYGEVGTIYNDPTEPTPAYDSNTMLDAFEPATVDALLSAAGPDAHAPLLIELRHLGGAYGRSAGPANAVGHRAAAFNLFAASILGVDGDIARVRRAHELLHEALQPWSTGGRVLNLLGTDDVDPDRVRTAYDEGDHARLSEIKRCYDPENMFRLNFNIPPAMASGA